MNESQSSQNGNQLGLVGSFVAMPSISSRLFQQKRRILVIDDDTEFSELLSEVMENEMDLIVDCASDASSALNKMNQFVYDAVILDWYLPRSLDNLETVSVSLSLAPDEPADWQIPVIVLSPHEQHQLEYVDTENFRIAGYVLKKQTLPQIIDDLKLALNEVFEMQLSA